MRDVYAVTTAILSTPEGGQVRVFAGTHWPAEDPLVRSHPDIFSDDPRYGLSYTAEPAAEVEEATANPGQRRSVRRG